MRQAAPLPDDYADVRAELAALRDRVAALESRFGPRDESERQVLLAIAAAVGSRRFSSQDLMAHAEVDAALAAALESADIVTVRECGKLLSRLAVRPIGGFLLTRVDTSRAGLIWSVQVLPPQTREALQ
jgi:hypothetical protein